jgi:hypothetical protein
MPQLPLTDTRCQMPLMDRLPDSIVRVLARPTRTHAALAALCVTGVAVGMVGGVTVGLLAVGGPLLIAGMAFGAARIANRTPVIAITPIRARRRSRRW